MNSISTRGQLVLAALGYTAVLLFAAAVLFVRHLQELQNPAEASGGMWAGGDLILYIFIACLLIVPTAFLIWVAAKFEGVYTAYSIFLLVLSLTAPVCLAIFHFGEVHDGQTLFTICLFRLIWSPFVLVAMGVSRIVVRFDRAKRFSSYALLIEGLTFVIAVALLIHAM
jgi:hypothetical protein